jgi:hypothetical protein
MLQNNAKNVSKGQNIFQMAIEYTNLFQFQGRPKFSQIWIFGLKIDHLATLLWTKVCDRDRLY